MWIQPPSQLPTSYICLTFLIMIHALYPKKWSKMWGNAASLLFLSPFPILTPSLIELHPVFSHKVNIRWEWKHMLLVGGNKKKTEREVMWCTYCESSCRIRPLFRPICYFNISPKPDPEGHRFIWLPLILLSKHPYDAFSTFGLAQCHCFLPLSIYPQ